MHQKAAVIDTNILVFDSFEDSENHEQAMNLLDTLSQWVIPAMVIHEYVWVLKGLELPLDFLGEKAHEYLFNEKTIFSPTDLSDINYALKEIENIADYNDFLILSTALRTNRSLATFDKKLRFKAKHLGLELIPSELTTDTPVSTSQQASS